MSTSRDGRPKPTAELREGRQPLVAPPSGLRPTASLEPPFAMVLPDGGRYRFRPVLPEDRRNFQRGLRWLSHRSRYARFGAPIARFSNSQLGFLTELDQRDHVAWAAIDPDAPHIPGVGVGRFLRLTHQPAVAEMIITVIDAYQGRGVGSTLLGLLYILARSRGVLILRGLVLPDRSDLAAHLRPLGVSTRYRDGVLEVDLPVYQDLSVLESTPEGRQFGSVLEALGEAWHPEPGTLPGSVGGPGTRSSRSSAMTARMPSLPVRT